MIYRADRPGQSTSRPLCIVDVPSPSIQWEYNTTVMLTILVDERCRLLIKKRRGRRSMEGAATNGQSIHESTMMIVTTHLPEKTYHGGNHVNA
jgi:hypothetical protein